MCKEAHHEFPILDLHYNVESQILTSIDSSGNVLQQQINKHRKFEVFGRPKRIFNAQSLSQARILLNFEGENEYFGLSSKGQVIKNKTAINSTIGENCTKILFVSTDIVVVRAEPNKLIAIPNLNQERSESKKMEYQHNCSITSV